MGSDKADGVKFSLNKALFWGLRHPARTISVALLLPAKTELTAKTLKKPQNPAFFDVILGSSIPAPNESGPVF
jgi:hypothetical protein